MDIKVNYEDFKMLEFYLFSLTFEKPLRVHVSFYDNDEVYEYLTLKVNDKLVLVTV